MIFSFSDSLSSLCFRSRRCLRWFCRLTWMMRREKAGLEVKTKGGALELFSSGHGFNSFLLTFPSLLDRRMTRSTTRWTLSEGLTVLSSVLRSFQGSEGHLSLHLLNGRKMLMPAQGHEWREREINMHCTFALLLVSVYSLHLYKHFCSL